MTPATERFPLRRHPRLRGRWPPLPRQHEASSKRLDADEDVLENIGFYPPRRIVLRTAHAGVALDRILFLTSEDIAKRLVAFLERQIGRTIAEISNTEIEL